MTGFSNFREKKFELVTSAKGHQVSGIFIIFTVFSVFPNLGIFITPTGPSISLPFVHAGFRFRDRYADRGQDPVGFRPR
jgi:hypothetical protein